MPGEYFFNQVSISPPNFDFALFPFNSSPAHGSVLSMEDWLDSANDGLEDNAGVLGAMGGMAALNNQRASLNKLSEIKDELAKAQASAAKTEKERLAIEKKRLALERAHLEEQKNTAN